MNIAVTGANGFVARNLRKYLSEQDINLTSISRKNFQTFKNETKIITTNYKSLVSKTRNFDALIHLVGAGKQSTTLSFDDVNVTITQRIVDLAKKSKIPKLIFLSGLGVSPHVQTDYFISKLKAERYITESKINYTIFRPSYIVGRDDLFTKYLKRSIKRDLVLIPGSGKYFIQPIYINDVTQLLLESVISHKFDNKIIDLVGPEIIPFKQYIKLFLKDQTKISHIDIENAYHLAITDPKFDYSVDDLNILMGNFVGNHEKLAKISRIKFHSVKKLLKTGTLL